MISKIILQHNFFFNDLLILYNDDYLCEVQLLIALLDLTNSYKRGFLRKFLTDSFAKFEQYIFSYVKASLQDERDFREKLEVNIMPNHTC